jgi:aspartyl-tRNA(Asn)/glutamyl-tRNA(Gln) amidotransferase subunit A
VWQVLSGTQLRPRQPGRVLALDALGGVTVQPAVEIAFQRALAVLPPDASISLPGNATAIRLAGFALAAAEMARHLGKDRHSDLLSAELKALLDFGESRAPNQSLLLATRRALVQALGEDGVLLLPTTPQAAFVQGGDVPVTQADFTGLANIAGLPALSLPAGQDEDGMPVAVQLVGPAGGEDLLFAVARRLDAELQSYAWPQ